MACSRRCCLSANWHGRLTPSTISRFKHHRKPKEASGIPEEGNLYELHFGSGYTWQARVCRCVPEQAFELEIITSDPDWSDTRVGFELTSKKEHTHVHFYNKGWPEKKQALSPVELLLGDVSTLIEAVHGGW